jgi:hypothetical protein
MWRACVRDRVHRHRQLAGDLRGRQVGLQVSQHPDLALAERLNQPAVSSSAPGCRGDGVFPSPVLRWQQAKALRDHGNVSGALPGVAFQQLRSRIEQERRPHAFGLGQIQCPLHGASGGGRIAECLLGDRGRRGRGWRRSRWPGTRTRSGWRKSSPARIGRWPNTCWPRCWGGRASRCGCCCCGPRCWSGSAARVDEFPDAVASTT